MASPAADGQRHRRGCLCGAVVYELHGPLRDVLVCHCVECRRWGGHAAAMTAVPKDRLVLLDDRGLRWIDSPDSARDARRGFCVECGSSLFWDPPRLPTISVAAGTLDGDTGLVTAGHIWVSQAGDYYDLPDDARRAVRAEPPEASSRSDSADRASRQRS
jgi:hypothetical protein